MYSFFKEIRFRVCLADYKRYSSHLRNSSEKDAPSSYRPIANVTFMSKIIEKLVASQMLSYLDSNKLLPSCQSGFRKGHSTESLVLHLVSDIYGAMEKSQLTILALFDATFGINDLPPAYMYYLLSLGSLCLCSLLSSSSPWCQICICV